MAGSEPPWEVLWSTGRTARALGVGPTTVQRWADDGRLPSVRTVGGHRRFRARDVAALRLSLDSAGAAAEHWANVLTGDDDTYQLRAALLGARARSGSWAPVADELGAGLDELGRRWQSGDCSIFEEHLASERLRRALANCCERIQVSRVAPRCLLLTAVGEEHTLGLSLVELVAREAGWQCDWLGRRTPIAELVRALEARRPLVVGVSASSQLADAAVLRGQYEELAELCRSSDAHLLMGGAGAWPDDPAHGVRLHSLQELPDFLASVAPSHRPRASSGPSQTSILQAEED